MSALLPPFKHTPIEAIPSTVDRVRETFHAHTTLPISYRLVQLRKLYWGPLLTVFAARLRDHEDVLQEALRRDLGKSDFDAFVGELGWCENDIVFVCANLEKWAKDEKAPDIPFANAAVSPKIRKDPFGVVLVIGAYNFPIQLSLGPLIGAIAAGCTAILKPSEVAPHTAAAVQMLVEKCLDPAAYRVVQGAVAETTELLKQKWDKIFYTGNAAVGTIVAKKAAETLTPVALELGGLNSAIVTKHADARLAARRLLWGKVMNAGQVCIAPNHVLVDQEILPAFLAELKASLAEFYPQGAKQSADYGRIVNQRHFQRIKAMLDHSRGQIVVGGETDEAERFIAPTIVLVDDLHDPILADEIFGPLLPVYAVRDLDEAIRTANKLQATPLGLYPFGTKAETDRVLRETRSGGASVNDAFFHGIIPTLSFGGVGQSGQGSYRGRASFECFTHRRSFTSTPSWIEWLLAVRYPPYSPQKLARFRRMSMLRPDFDRHGRVQVPLLRRVLALGAGSWQTALGRYLLLVAVATVAQRYFQTDRLR
ncbi:MAG: hypothetical protein M1826_003623 [Phylliscum demangeonii]|nr:MAG: hypothetical protein M1826_003623 [Phylliscum demangeonii]